MKFYDLFLLSTRMFKARTSRTLLTILGMGVGISAILFLVALGYGLQNTILERITTSDSILTLDIFPDRSSSAILDEPTLEKIKGINGVAEISPAFQLNAKGKIDDLTTELPVMAAASSYFRLSGIKLAEGQAFTDEDQGSVVISSAVARIFSKSIQEMVGKEISLTFTVPEESLENDKSAEGSQDNSNVNIPKTYKIIGAIESDENIIYLSYASLGDLNLTHFSQVKAKCQSNKIMADVRSQIQDMGFSVSSLSETVDQANKVFNVIKIVLMLFGIIALIVSAIGMFNTMTITLLERTEEIGIMKSIGASDTTISLIFVMESTIMGLLGGFMGIFIGWTEGKVFNTVVNFIATRFGGQKVSLFYYPWWFVLTIIIFAAVVGFATGVIPARRAAKTDPLEALRYK